jgi:hypothetical protein
MDENIINKKLLELIQKIINLPQEDFKRLTSFKKLHKENEDSNDQTTQLLEDLQLCIKYLLFDLEATKRELNQLRAILKQNPRQNEDDDEFGEAMGEM